MKLNKERFFDVVNDALTNMVDELENGFATPVPLTVCVNGRYTFTELDAFSWNRMEKLLLDDTALQVETVYSREKYKTKHLSVKKFIRYFEKVVLAYLDGGENGESDNVTVILGLGNGYTELYLCADVYHILKDELNKIEKL